MSDHAPLGPPALALPEEFLLLVCGVWRPRPYDEREAGTGCAVAELGELALGGWLRVPPRRKRRLFGFNVYQLHGGIQLFGSGPVGVPWADEVLAELDLWSAPDSEPPELDRWLGLRRWAALDTHRDTLVQRGLLTHPPYGSGLRHHRSDKAALGALLDRLRTALASRSFLDGRTLFLLDLVEETGLGNQLGLRMNVRQRLAYARGVGVVAAVPEPLRDTSTILSAYARPPSATTGSGGGGGGGGDGGDGGGGE